MRECSPEKTNNGCRIEQERKAKPGCSFAGLLGCARGLVFPWASLVDLHNSYSFVHEASKEEGA